MKEKNNNSIKAKLTEGSVGRLLIRLTLPMIMGIMSMVIYNLVDTFFVSRLGKDQMAALAFTFPVVLVVGSVAHGLGVGTSALVSRAIGENNLLKVKRLATDSLVLSFLTVAVFVTAGLLTIDPLFRMLGANERILPYIKEYMSVWYPGMVFVVFPMVGNNIIRATGDSKTPGLVMLTGAIMNSLLDPLLIFGSEALPFAGPFLGSLGIIIKPLGIRGAAAATLIGRSITFLVALYILVWREKLISFKKCSLREISESWKEILEIGIPNAGTRMIIPIGSGIITRLIADHGTAYVAGYGIATRIEFFSLAAVRALSSITGPFIGQNFGAGLFSRVRKGIKRGNQFSVILGGLIFITLFFSADFISSLFSSNYQTASAAALYLKIVSAGYGMQGICLISASILNVFRKPFHAVFISIAEIFILSVPLSIAANRLLGIWGIYSAISFSYITAGIFAYILVKNTVKNSLS